VTPDDRAVQRLFELREALETHAVACAAERRTAPQLAAIAQWAAATEEAVAANDRRAFGDTDRHLHLAIAEAADNPYLLAVLGAVRQMQVEVIHLITLEIGSMAVAIAQHRHIVAAIADGAVDGAVAAMRAHIRYTAGVVHRLLTVDANGHDGRDLEQTRELS
jgi:DNA-binding FadR family transcriptional regulator